MKLGLILACMFLLAARLHAGNIYEVKSSGEADAKVYLAGSVGEADLCVFVADNQSAAKGKDEVWCYVSSPSAADAKKIFLPKPSPAPTLRSSS